MNGFFDCEGDGFEVFDIYDFVILDGAYDDDDDDDDDYDDDDDDGDDDDDDDVAADYPIDDFVGGPEDDLINGDLL